MGIQQILTGLGNAADPQKVLSTGRKKTSSDEEVKKADETTLKDKVELSEEGLKIDQMVKELDRTMAGIKDDQQTAVKAQANVSGYSALEVLDESFGSVYAQLDLLKDHITNNTQTALDTQSNLVSNSVLETISN